MAKKKEVESVRFFRGTMPTHVWDAENNRMLCSLTEGHMTTSDRRVIQIMRDNGYPEVALDAAAPPEVIEAIQPDGMADVKGVPKGLTEAGVAKLQSEDEHGPAVVAPVVAKEEKPTKEPPRRKVKRRTPKK